AEIADGEEREIVIVGDAVEERVAAALAHDAVLQRRPEIGADDEFARRAVQQHDLGVVLIVADLPLAALPELGDDQVAEKVAIVGKLLELNAPGGEIVLVGGIEIAGFEHLDQIGERELLVGAGVDQARHWASPAASGASAKNISSVCRAVARTSGWGSFAA